MKLLKENNKKMFNLIGMFSEKEKCKKSFFTFHFCSFNFVSAKQYQTMQPTIFTNIVLFLSLLSAFGNAEDLSIPCELCDLGKNEIKIIFFLVFLFSFINPEKISLILLKRKIAINEIEGLMNENLTLTTIESQLISGICTKLPMEGLVRKLFLLFLFCFILFCFWVIF
jgi:hypothetical protein